MSFISYEDFKKMDEYQTFIEENPSTGYLKIEAFTAYRAIPVENVEILITKDINNDKVVFFRGYTDSSGMINNIELPAPAEQTSISPENPPKYTLYDLTAIHQGYESIKKYDIGMFGGIKVIQYVKMTPEIEIEGNDKIGN